MFFSSAKPKLLLAIDIGATSVRGAVFWAHKDARPEIAGIFEAKTKINEKANLESLQKDIYGAVKIVLGQVMKSTPRHLDGVFISLCSPWYFSQTRVLEAERGESFVVTEDFIAKIMRDEESKVISESAVKFGLAKDDLMVLEKSHMKSFLNGYHVKNIYNKQAKNFRAHVFVSVVMKKMVDELTIIMREILGVQGAHFHTSPHVMYSVMREAFDANNGFLSIEVGEEITDIMYVRDGFIEEVSSFARGGNFVMRRIASFFKIATEEAESLFRTYEEGRLNSDEEKKLRKIIETAADEWSVFFAKILEHFRSIAGVPESAFVFGSSEIVKLFADAAADKSLARFTMTASPIKVNILVPGALKEGFFKQTKLLTHQETIVAFLVLFFNGHVWQKKEN
jgi:cell division ATPase FtsA